MGLFDRKKKVRRVYWNDPDGSTLAASFWMEGEELRVKWESTLAQRMLEKGGLIPPNETAKVYPRDGRRFYDALPGALSQASRMFVRDEKE